MAKISKETLNEWWNSCGFKEMELITGYKQYEFSPDDGYQDFVDACNDWWEYLPTQEKINLYELYNTPL